jgi:hypothetical protein
MFFLLRMTFWLAIVCMLLPGSGATSSDDRFDTASAVTAASAAVSDMANFCDRQPGACVVGGQVAVALGQKAEAGARTLYQIISAKLTEKPSDKTAEKSAAPITTGQIRPVMARGNHGASHGTNHGTLTPADLAPRWHAPVPLPPRREARAGRPTA